jgi:hypothetical protein
MISHPLEPAHRNDDDLDARTRRIRCRLLDGIEQTLDELAQPRVLRAAIEREVRVHAAALLCRHARCRRAQRCRRDPCAVPSEDAQF